MRGLISAALVLAPALASALRVHEVDFDHEPVGEVTAIGIHPICSVDGCLADMN